MHVGRMGSLATMSQKQPGWPFGSVMPYAVDESGRPIFLISTMAMHTKNLLAEPRASLLVAQPEIAGDPLGAARVTVMGKAARVTADEKEQVKRLYLSRHENAGYWVDFGDFSFFRLEVVDVYYVGGFGVMGWVSASDYGAALVDPLADVASALIEKLNAERASGLAALARRMGHRDVERAKMTAIDRLGFHLRITTGDRVQAVRIALPRPISSAEEMLSGLEELIHKATKEENS